jgi:hypothetical protein
LFSSIEETNYTEKEIEVKRQLKATLVSFTSFFCSTFSVAIETQLFFSLTATATQFFFGRRGAVCNRLLVSSDKFFELGAWFQSLEGFRGEVGPN